MDGQTYMNASIAKYFSLRKRGDPDATFALPYSTKHAVSVTSQGEEISSVYR